MLHTKIQSINPLVLMKPFKDQDGWAHKSQIKQYTRQDFWDETLVHKNLVIESINSLQYSVMISDMHIPTICQLMKHLVVLIFANAV